jgi:hypothetical protein
LAAAIRQICRIAVFIIETGKTCVDRIQQLLNSPILKKVILIKMFDGNSDHRNGCFGDIVSVILLRHVSSFYASTIAR